VHAAPTSRRPCAVRRARETPHHGRIADGELRGLAEHRGERLRVPTGRGQVDDETVLLEQLRVLCNVEVDITEVMYGLGELDGLQRRRGSGVSEPEGAERASRTRASWDTALLHTTQVDAGAARLASLLSIFIVSDLRIEQCTHRAENARHTC